MHRRILAVGGVLALLGASLEAQKIGRVSAGNSTTTPLTGNASFVGSFDDVTQCTVATVVVRADVAGATNGVIFDWSDDGVTVVYTAKTTYTDTVNGQSIDQPCSAKFLRVTFTNGAGAQATFRLQTLVRDAGFGGPSSGGAGSSDVTVHDPTITTQKLAVSATGRAQVDAAITGTPTVSAAQSGAPWTVSGVKGNNAGAAGTSNLGVLPGIANASAPTWTEGNQVGLSFDLNGNARTILMNGGATGTNAASGTTNEALVQQDATLTVTGTLQSAATANGNGTALTVTGEASAVITANCASCSGGTTLNFEGSEDNANFFSITAVQLGTTTLAQTTTTAGLTAWVVSVANLQKLRVRISNYSAGTVTVTAHASPVLWSTFVTSVAQGPAATNSAAWPVRPTDGLNAQAFDPSGSAMSRCVNCAPTLTAPLPFGFASALGRPQPGQSGVVMYGGSFGSYITNFNDPCTNAVGKQTIAISQTTSTRLLQAVAGRVYVCNYKWVGADAEAISLVEGGGTLCATSTVAIDGATTAANGPNYAANSGSLEGNGGAAVLVSNTPGNDICLLQSGTGRVAGHLTFVIR